MRVSLFYFQSVPGEKGPLVLVNVVPDIPGGRVSGSLSWSHIVTFKATLYIVHIPPPPLPHLHLFYLSAVNILLENPFTFD